MHGPPASSHLKHFEIIGDYWYKYITGWKQQAGQENNTESVMRDYGRGENGMCPRISDFFQDFFYKNPVGATPCGFDSHPPAPRKLRACGILQGKVNTLL